VDWREGSSADSGRGIIASTSVGERVRLDIEGESRDGDGLR